MERLNKICKELNDKLTKEYGEYGNIICTIENNYLYFALNFDYEERVYDFIDNILKKYNTYFELENSCIMTIF